MTGRRGKETEIGDLYCVFSTIQSRINQREGLKWCNCEWWDIPRAPLSERVVPVSSHQSAKKVWYLVRPGHMPIWTSLQGRKFTNLETLSDRGHIVLLIIEGLNLPSGLKDPKCASGLEQDSGLFIYRKIKVAFLMALSIALDCWRSNFLQLFSLPEKQYTITKCG